MTSHFCSLTWWGVNCPSLHPQRQCNPSCVSIMSDGNGWTYRRSGVKTTRQQISDEKLDEKKMQLKLKTEENIVYVYAWSSNGGLSQNCPNTLPHPPLADRWDWLQLPRDPTKVFKVENGLMVKSLVVKELMKQSLTSVALTCNIPHSQSDHMGAGGRP